MKYIKTHKSGAYLDRLMNRTGTLWSDYEAPPNSNKTRATNRTKPKRRRK